MAFNWQNTHIGILPPTLLITVTVAAVSALIFRHTALKKLPFRLIVLLLLLGETIKQTLALANGDYSLSYLPLHFSSSFYLSTFLAAFGRGRVERFGFASTYVGGFFLLIVFLISPGSVVGGLNDIFAAYFTAHSFFMHLLILLFWLTLLFSGLYYPERYDYLYFWCFLMMWTSVALPFANRFGINYAGLIKSYIPFLETLRLNWGNTVYLVCYGGLAFIASYLLLALYRLLRRAYDGRKPKALPLCELIKPDFGEYVLPAPDLSTGRIGPRLL